MTIKFYNTLTRTLEDFKPIKEKEVSIYACGPTVYNYLHIGNFAAATFNDLLTKYLRYKGYKVKYVSNITDVDDKTIRTAKEQKKPLKEVTDFYIKNYLEDLETLKINKPDIMPRATEEIDGMVQMVKVLLEKGHAYKTDRGDIYFKISSFKDYGKLTNLDKQKLRENADGRLSNADEYEKENASDFALWKAYDADDGDIFWETEIGKGRPGWHLECSVMSSKYLGQPFDIHCGGIDLVFPHHTNEIAQSECACDKKLANYWMHNAHLMVDGKKMSKSLGNYYTLRDVLNKGYEPLCIRFELLKNHYRQPLDFRFDNMDQNKRVLKKFKDFMGSLKLAGAGNGVNAIDSIITTAKESFVNGLDDDLNISQALAAIFSFMNEVNKELQNLNKDNVTKIIETMNSFNSVLSILEEESSVENEDEINNLIAQRTEAKKNKDFKRADDIRDELLSMGIAIKDTPQGVVWEKL